MTRKLPERAILVQAYLTLSRSAPWMSSGFRLERRLWLKACVRGAGPFPQTVRALEPSATGSRYTDDKSTRETQRSHGMPMADSLQCSGVDRQQ